MNFYQFSARMIDGKEKAMSDFKGKVILVVNTASQCAFTKQFEQLQDLYVKYRNQGLEILGFPCNQFREQDPGSNEEIANFCTLQYDVSFPMFEKIQVNGENTHLIYQYLKSQQSGIFGTKNIKWNFTKFLINRNGIVVARYAPSVNPANLEKVIAKYLSN